MTDVWVLAFDIEATGSRSDNGDIIAIGASVVDSAFNEWGNLNVRGYIPGETIFEERCKIEFWDKHPEKLKSFIYEGELTRRERQADMIRQFQGFRFHCEKAAAHEGKKLELCSDNNVFDGGFINEYITKYTRPDEYLPIPYNASEKKYKPFWETHAQQRGLLMAVDPDFKGDWGLSKRIAELYDVPECPVSHDHDPANDARTIAHEQQVLLAIRDGRIKRR